jgi:mRNA interferase MazF
MTAYRKWDIILVPFPFKDLTDAKKRPALVVSPDNYDKSGQDVVIVLLTSRMDVSPRPGDCRIRFWKESGLPKAALLRMKFAAIAQEIIAKRMGRLFQEERSSIRDALKEFFLK